MRRFKDASQYTHLVGTTIDVPSSLMVALLKGQSETINEYAQIIWVPMRIIGIDADVNALVGVFPNAPMLDGLSQRISVEFYEWCTQFQRKNGNAETLSKSAYAQQRR